MSTVQHRGAEMGEDSSAEPLATRLLAALVSAMELYSVELGTRHGLYEALRDLGPISSTELARACHVDQRYLREWLEQQATSGLIDVAAAGDTSTRRYALSQGQASVLVDPESPYAMAAAAAFLHGLGNAFDAVADDFVHGDGVSYAAFGPSVRHAIAALNRPSFARDLGTWVAAMPDIDVQERAQRTVIIDAGCGTGWSTLALAREFPMATVIGMDLDEESIADAETRLTQVAETDAALASRVRFVRADAGDPVALHAIAPDGAALITVFEALHDMNRPAAVLAALGTALADGGAILVGDEKVADEFTPNGDQLERLNYAFSVLHCLPATIAEGPGEANGTVLRPATVRRWATQAGLSRVTDLDIENDLWRFYRIDRG
ncbi:SAM-dependent methyltransferase [Microbacterium sp. W4I4]|uniref:class I SAM-dependent methyltransferase n=1 Tax=Microbacterium sp. W4I4 TaxID=3042295 RepID=UPI00278B6316|nr:class I SAM-dependent methyltransferase [Microbacterium sp. W4I4]MDQ0612536.1 SAM-dependent methyltransferase [Microbacterium sp. W4I4]